MALLDDLKDRAVGPVPKLPAVILTFDDGLVTDYEIAFPLLAEFGQRAVFFLNTATIGQAEISRLGQDCGDAAQWNVLSIP